MKKNREVRTESAAGCCVNMGEGGGRGKVGNYDEIFYVISKRFANFSCFDIKNIRKMRAMKTNEYGIGIRR